MSIEPPESHAHGHKTGLPWLDIIVALSAVVISVVSLVVSIEHGRIMQRMVEQNGKLVEASTLPYLTFGASELDPQTGKDKLSLILKNGGVGPAVIGWFQLRLDGKALSVPGFLHACCQAALPDHNAPIAGLAYSTISSTVLPARETVSPLVLSSEANPALYAALIKAQDRVSVKACYCSVLGECWITGFQPGRPAPVAKCEIPPHEPVW